MRRAENLVGVRFTRLVVLSRAETSGQRKAQWHCQCDCGNQKVISGSDLRAQKVKACGCLRTQILVERSTTHGKHDTVEYSTWKSMLARCRDPSNISYERYGAKGVTVCERWQSFENFIEDMGPRPPNYSIDRIDSSGNYEPSNCRWASDTVQSRNRSVCLDEKSINTIRHLSSTGITGTAVAKITGLNTSRVNRLLRGATYGNLRTDEEPVVPVSAS